ncbi:hypothetical protein DNTS_014369 [Danionella cerebrum]|uniref:Receptor activity-modifying protein 2 n=1 Tax=Danionella cerebrum TaxID=2873325 RepID=A0A553QTC8_9TELE|nr:hypothetical protein DNTS_014369 [Danionella translucida]
MVHKIPAGTLLFWVSLYLMVTTLQTLVPDEQKHSTRLTVSTFPTDIQTTAYTRAAQDCYEILVHHWCKYNFVVAMDAMNNTDWCSLERVKSAYNNFTVCTETVADCLLLPWPNRFVEQTFVDIHRTYFQDCPSEALSDPPLSIILALVMTPICLIPVMVVLVVLKTKNGDMRS